MDGATTQESSCDDSRILDPREYHSAKEIGLLWNHHQIGQPFFCTDDTRFTALRRGALKMTPLIVVIATIYVHIRNESDTDRGVAH